EEQALHQSNEKFSKIFKTSPDAITITRLCDGTYLEVNQAFLDTTGFTAEEVLGHSSLPVPGGIGLWACREDRDRMVETLNAHGEVLGMEVSLRMKNGAIRSVLFSARIMEINGEKCTMIVARDITENKRMELELQKMQKLESIGVLAGGIAHDFNNLLGGIFGYIEMAHEISKDPKVTYYLSKVMGSIDRARGITDQLLTFAKGGAPIRKITPIPSFIQEVAQLALSGSDISCNFKIAENLWLCNIDKNQVAQVIDNLIINAHQAMPDGGSIEVKAENVSFAEKEHVTLEAGNYVKISIKDQGLGIPKEILPRIFDPFFTTKPKGRGLGLAVCHSIIYRHGGVIQVESEPGEGSAFHAFLPASPESVFVKPASVTGHRGRGTIVFMDDEKEMQEIVGEMLEDYGYSVISKNNGSEAVEFFIEETKAGRAICALIFDLTVPGGMGGKKAVEEIRKLDKDIPVFVTSGYSNDPVMKNPVEYGFTGSIAKPFRKNELAEMLNKYLPGG
ncbi:MAG: ATP-binding protein, partial [Chitinivibrionales bacterium]|nr:ATP-binding protein [Chitinivibrionales bacterium]